VRNKIIPLLGLFVGYDSRAFINLEFLALWRVGIIENPLLEWNISTDKIKKLANYFILVLNDLQ